MAPKSAYTGDARASALSSGSMRYPSASPQLILLENRDRTMAMFYNASDTDVYLKHSGSVSTTDFTLIIEPRAYYELPKPIYTGDISVVWMSPGTGSMAVTEMY